MKRAFGSATFLTLVAFVTLMGVPRVQAAASNAQASPRNGGASIRAMSQGQSSMSGARQPRLSAVLGLATCAANGGGFTVCIDPGHPSEVGRGTRGRRITEIQAAWRVALKVKALLQAQGVGVVLTKNSANEFVRNRRRAEIANESHANLMVRLHCDAEAGSGTATYFPDRQGVSHGFRGPSREVIEESNRAAHTFHAAMMKDLRGRLRDRGVHSDIETAVGSHQGALTGSIFSQVPVLLVEMCVLTTSRDDAFMASNEGQTLMARAVTDGVMAALNP